MDSMEPLFWRLEIAIRYSVVVTFFGLIVNVDDLR